MHATTARRPCDDDRFGRTSPRGPWPVLALAATSVLLLAACTNDEAAAMPSSYSDLASWKLLPVGTPTQPVDVFFVHPTTYSASPGTLGPTYSSEWNQSIAQAQLDASITDQLLTKTAVFFKAGTNLYAPYYRQASGLETLNALLWGKAPQNAAAANEALELAYSDVAAAFDFYLAHYNRGSDGKPRPFILAGHSQGSNLLLLLLERRFTDPELRAQLVVAYLLGWSVTADDLAQYSSSLGQLGICASSAQTGCVVTYNTQQYPGDFSQVPTMSLVRKNALSVNPLTWAATGPGAAEPTTVQETQPQNLGAVFSPFILPSNDQWDCSWIGNDQILNREIPGYTGAQSSSGALVIDPTVLPSPAAWNQLKPPYAQPSGCFHNYDYNFFFRNIEQNVIDRISAYTHTSIGAGRSHDQAGVQYCALPTP
jgi:hypothetical protein